MMKPKQFLKIGVDLLMTVLLLFLMAFMLSKLFGVTGVWMAFPVTEVVTFGIAMGIQGVSKRKE